MEAALSRHLLFHLGRVAEAAADAFELGAGGGQGEVQGLVFRQRSCHAGQGADLGVRQLSGGEGGVNLRQAAQSARYAHLLARGPSVQTDSPREPVGAALGALLAPGFGLVEAANARQQTMRRDVDLGGQRGNLLTQRK